MTPPDGSPERWENLAADLRAYRDALRETWGDLEDTAVANYLSGKPTEAERAAVEKAMQEKQAVRDLIATVQQVLEPAWVSAPQAAGPAAAQNAKRLTETLRVWISEVGKVVASGAEVFMMQPAFADISLDAPIGPPQKQREVGIKAAFNEHCWTIPLEDLDGRLVVRTKPSAQPGNWLFGFELLGQIDPDVCQQAGFAISEADDPSLPIIQGRLSEHSGKFIELRAGKWDLSLDIDRVARIIAFELGDNPSIR